CAGVRGAHVYPRPLGLWTHVRRSVTASSRPGTFRGDLARTRLERVVDGSELGRLPAGAVGERLREQPVGELRIPRQQRPVQIRPDRASEPASLVAALAVVSEPGDDAAERLGARV